MPQLHTVRMGEIVLARSPDSLRTLLGSCIGIAVQESTGAIRVGVMAHILLPISGGRNVTPGKYVDTAMPELIRLIQPHCHPNATFIADVAGGADMFDVGTQRTVGRLNIAALDEVLTTHQVRVRSRNLGGRQGRRMTMDVATGVVSVQTIDEIRASS